MNAVDAAIEMKMWPTAYNILLTYGTFVRENSSFHVATETYTYSGKDYSLVVIYGRDGFFVEEAVTARYAKARHAKFYDGVLNQKEK